MLRIVTYNCHGMKNSIVDLHELCKHHDLIFLQEIWLFRFELNLISTIHPDLNHTVLAQFRIQKRLSEVGHMEGW